QRPVSEIADASLALTNATQRERVSQYMMGMGYMPDELPAIASCYQKLAPNGPDSQSAADFMRARLANAERRWSDAVAFALRAELDPVHRNPARLLRANSLGRLGQISAAFQVLDAVEGDKDATRDHRARGAFVRVIVKCLEAGRVPPDEAEVKAFPDT